MMLIRQFALLGIALSAISMILVSGAEQAGAHGDSSADTEVPNYVTTIIDSGHPGLSWSTDIAEAKIRLTNNTDETVIVFGYRSEPYLRFDPSGEVWWNASSPSSYLNQDRYGDAEIPPQATPDAEPDWQQLGQDHSYAWYDHRAHWMTRAEPAAVISDPDRAHDLSEWAIPLQIGDTATQATGELRWEPNLTWWPPLIALAALFTTLLAAILILTKPADNAWPQPAWALAALVLVVATANLVRGVDEALTHVGGTSSQVLTVITTVVPIAAIVALANKGRTGHQGAYAALLAAAVLTAIIFGAQSTTQLTDPQLLTGLPEWIRRWTVAASFAIIAPASLAAFIASRTLTPNLPKPQHAPDPHPAL